METQMIEKYQNFKINSNISIRPYVEELQPNMGLEKYNMVVYEGIFHEEPLACIEQNGVKRYITGLNEYAPELNLLTDDEREGKIKTIRTIVAKAERELSSINLDIKDEKFWEKVQKLRPDNSDFWDKIVIRCGNEPIYLDPEKDIYDLIKITCIEANGFSMIAKSLEDARKRNPKPRFYLDRFEETITVKTEYKKMRNKALAELDKLYNKNITKLFYICKVIDINSTQYRKKTPSDVMYDAMDKYINGELFDRDKKLTASNFINISNLDVETLKLRALVKDATAYKIVSIKGDGMIYYLKSNTMLGKNPSDAVEYLRNPLNSETLNDMIKTIEYYWNN